MYLRKCSLLCLSNFRGSTWAYRDCNLGEKRDKEYEPLGGERNKKIWKFRGTKIQIRSYTHKSLKIVDHWAARGTNHLISRPAYANVLLKLHLSNTTETSKFLWYYIVEILRFVRLMFNADGETAADVMRSSAAADVMRSSAEAGVMRSLAAATSVFSHKVSQCALKWQSWTSTMYNVLPKVPTQNEHLNSK